MKFKVCSCCGKIEENMKVCNHCGAVQCSSCAKLSKDVCSYCGK